jgi:hypothetical protein
MEIASKVENAICAICGHLRRLTVSRVPSDSEGLMSSAGFGTDGTGKERGFGE